MTPRLTHSAAALTAVVALVAGASAAPRLVWNTTASAPIGLYAVAPVGRLAVGDWVALRPPPRQARWLAARGYLPSGALLIKRVAALPPSRVCRAGDDVSVDGVLAARAKGADRWRRPLPQWSGCAALGPAELFLLNPAPGSLDSRYLGPWPRVAVVGRLHPLIVTRSAADAG